MGQDKQTHTISGAVYDRIARHLQHDDSEGHAEADRIAQEYADLLAALEFMYDHSRYYSPVRSGNGGMSCDEFRLKWGCAPSAARASMEVQARAAIRKARGE